jgi:hypothetical protein
MRFYLLVVLFSIVLVSCTKKQKYSNTPLIAFTKFSKNTTKQFVGEDIVLFSTFKDGDGDIGIAENAGNVVLTDSRDSTKFSYGFPKIDAEYITTQGVSGAFYINLIGAGIKLKDTSKAFEKFVWFIEVTDKAGNISNKVSTDSFTVTKL